MPILTIYCSYQNYLYYLQIMMFDTIVEKIMSVADEDNQFENLWEIKSIRFDVDPEDEKKKIQTPIGISSSIQDLKGHPGSKGTFMITNLRATWELNNDRYTNLSFGLDSILSMIISELPSYSSGSKYLLIVKTENLNHQRYEFKFMGFSETDHRIFSKLSELHKQALNSKNYRKTTFSLKCDPEFIPLEREEVKSTFQNFLFFENEEKNVSTVILTNIRLIIIRKNVKGMNYGIPWIMIKSFRIAEMATGKGIRFFCRGSLVKKITCIKPSKESQLTKFYQQLKSFCETYNKYPVLGLQEKRQKQIEIPPKRQQEELVEIQETKVKLHKRKNAYSSGKTKGFLQQAQFNKDLGLMMQKLPEGVTRQSLWQLLQS